MNDICKSCWKLVKKFEIKFYNVWMWLGEVEIIDLGCDLQTLYVVSKAWFFFCKAWIAFAKLEISSTKLKCCLLSLNVICKAYN